MEPYVWNTLPCEDSALNFLANAPLTSAESNQRMEDDKLPPFVELETDEQREQKASFHKPGTFTVIANQQSFERLSEYQLGGISSTKSDPKRSSSVEQSQPLGPDNFVLHRFEEHSYNYNTQSDHSHSRTVSSRSDTSSHGDSAYLTPREMGDALLLEHYRNVLAQQICWLTDHGPGPDIFEKCAKTYLPVSGSRDFLKYRELLTNKLYFAIIALSSLSLSRFNKNSFADVL